MAVVDLTVDCSDHGSEKVGAKSLTKHLQSTSKSGENHSTKGTSQKATQGK